MDVGATVRKARQGAGWTQRELARHTGVAQPTIARIEGGTVDPRMSTVDRLLRACGVTLLPTPRKGVGVDRSQFRELLRLSPRERLEMLRADVEGLRRLERAARR